MFESEDIVAPIDYLGSGGRLLVAGDKLFFTVGDFDFSIMNPPFGAQSLTSLFGKIFRYNIITGELHLISIGHRNSQGLVITTDGRLLETEHGPEGGDELNLIIDGKNYGWPYQTYGTNRA